jgi:hypothetical protein
MVGRPFHPDTREAVCERKDASKVHMFRDACFYADGRHRCVYCGRRKRLVKRPSA